VWPKRKGLSLIGVICGHLSPACNSIVNATTLCPWFAAMPLRPSILAFAGAGLSGHRCVSVAAV
jgi:hypothetical protein